MRIQHLFLLVHGCLASVGAAVSDDANICGRNATIGAAVVRAMNLSWPGLEAAKSAADQGDLNGACNAIAGYYRNSTSTSWERIGPVAPGTRLVGSFGGAIDVKWNSNVLSWLRSSSDAACALERLPFFCHFFANQ